MKRQKDEGVKPMTIEAYNAQHEKSMKEMQIYIDNFYKMGEEQAKQEAKESLIRTGVMTSKGIMKKRICN